VQGVGFRPFVYRLAAELELGGWVRNDERGVELEVEGPAGAIDAFLARLPAAPPPLAVVEEVHVERMAVMGESAFAIVPSARSADADALITPDAATCAACLAELFDPTCRRFRYPFVNCTDCGPRFTIVRGIPYDRSRTTMADFAMCADCAAEYDDPRDRRFHAQPNACPRCGPRARLLLGTGPDRPGDADDVARAARLIARGAIVAVKGLGGYHLACRADDESAVATLRARKRREDRPFALMTRDLAGARRLALVEEHEARLLQGPARPIVLVGRRHGAAVAPSVAPRAPELGLMLAYTPLHHVLLADLQALGGDAVVLTSGNVSDEPIAYEDEDALERLAPIADAFLTHDRPIHMRTDDSVVRAVLAGGRRRTLPVRRSRGHVPSSLDLPVPASRTLLACGAELKSTFCLARGRRAWPSHHIGDLRNWETLRSFRAAVPHLEGLLAVTPDLVAHDLHPDYLSTAYALQRDDVELLGVQHHHAHLAAVLAEHGERGPAVGAIYDGSGYGSDGTAWGGELLVGGLTGFRRAGHLRPVALPGGDRAVREPWRMASAWLAEATGSALASPPPALQGRVAPERWSAVARMLRGGVASPPTTSVGRLCDAVAALCGLRAEVNYEGQAAIELEALADPAERGAYEIRYAGGELDPRPAIVELEADLAAGAGVGRVSARFHRGLASATAEACVGIAECAGLELVVLAGGVFQNRLLVEGVAAAVQAAGLRVLTPERLPPNDGAISFGQAAIAAATTGS
jgi:hydrogenase maturation protein HypF